MLDHFLFINVDAILIMIIKVCNFFGSFVVEYLYAFYVANIEEFIYL